MRLASLCRLTAVSALVLASSVASAQKSSSNVVITRPWDLMDLAGGGPRVGAEISYDHVESGGFLDADYNGIELNLVGQFPLGDTIDLWARIPLVFGGGMQVGNVGLGVVAKLHDGRTSSGGRLKMGIEGGAYLPTATDPDDADEFEPVVAAVFSRTFLFPRWFNDNMDIRGGFGVRFETGRAFFQGDAGLDLVFETEDDRNDDDSDILMRLGVGGGAEVAANIAIIGELTFIDNLDDADSGIDDDSAVQFSVGARFRAGTALSLGPALMKSIDLPDRFGQIGFRFDVLGYF